MEEPVHDTLAAKYGMWFFLFTEILFFGGMFLLYSVYRSKFPVEFHAAAKEEDLFFGSLNTAILLTSSLTMAMSISAVRKGNNGLAALLQAATIVFGIAFLGIKYFEWGEKITRGLYPNSPVMDNMDHGTNLFFGLYYVMTGLHGLHVFVGVVVISFMIYFTSTETVTAQNFSRLENTGLYWHFVDIVWIYLFPLFYLVT